MQKESNEAAKKDKEQIATEMTVDSKAISPATLEQTNNTTNLSSHIQDKGITAMNEDARREEELIIKKQAKEKDDALMEDMLFTLRTLINESERQDPAIVLFDGVTLRIITDEYEKMKKSIPIYSRFRNNAKGSSPYLEAFLKVIQKAKLVICCRVSPIQKAQVARLVSDSIGGVTLAIGDGGNDVSMIQTANVGVGIWGKEGTQAARASDFAIRSFALLPRLLFVHGRYAALRAELAMSTGFYKSIAFFFLQFLFSFYNKFSGTVSFPPVFFLSFSFFLLNLNYFFYFHIQIFVFFNNYILLCKRRFYFKTNNQKLFAHTLQILYLQNNSFFKNFHTIILRIYLVTFRYCNHFSFLLSTLLYILIYQISSQSLHDDFIVMSFNSVTILPSLIIGTTACDHQQSELMQRPQLYNDIKERDKHALRNFLGWLLLAIFHSTVIFTQGVLLPAESGVISPHGDTADLRSVSVYASLAGFIVTTAQMALAMPSWNIVSILGFLGTAALIALTHVFLGLFPFDGNHVYAQLRIVFTQPTFYVTMFLVVVTALLPNYLFKWFRKSFPLEKVLDLIHKKNKPKLAFSWRDDGV